MRATLYHYWRSSCSWRVRWSLAHKGLLQQESVKLVTVNLLNGESESPAHLERHPLGFVPVLELPDGRSLIESLAILEWLEETSPQPPLLPADPFARATARALAQVIVSDTQPLQNLGPQFLHAPNDASARSYWAQHWIREGLRAYETLAQGAAGKFSVGDELSLADLCLVPQLYNARRYEISTEQEFPLLHRIEKAAESLPSWFESHPDRFAPPT